MQLVTKFIFLYKAFICIIYQEINDKQSMNGTRKLVYKEAF